MSEDHLTAALRRICSPAEFDELTLLRATDARAADAAARGFLLRELAQTSPPAREPGDDDEASFSPAGRDAGATRSGPPITDENAPQPPDEEPPSREEIARRLDDLIDGFVRRMAEIGHPLPPSKPTPAVAVPDPTPEERERQERLRAYKALVAQRRAELDALIAQGRLPMRSRGTRGAPPKKNRRSGR